MDEKAPVFLFDDVRVEPAAFRVWKAGAHVPVEPKALEVLLFLIKHRGRVVQKRELLDSVWRDTFVGENALTREIAQLRKALGEDARRARYIETVPTRGYRFIAEVEEVPAAPNDNGAVTPNGAGSVVASNGAAANGAVTNGTGAAAQSPRFTPSTDAVGVRRVKSRRAFLLAAGAALVLLLCVGGLVWWGFSRGARAGETTVGVQRLTQVTTSTGLDIFPAISPDGGYVAYSSNSGGDFEIYVRQLAPGGRELLITSDGGRNFQPAWSPDGQFIAYYSQRRGGLWLVPAMGGVARRLTDFGSKPAWSPDGQQIAFQSAPLHDLVGVQGGALPPSTVWVVPVRGGTPRQLTKAGVPSGGHGSPVWWPGGKRILFFSFDLMLNEVWSVSVETGEVRRHGPGVQPFSDIIFSPDGRYAYCAGAYRGTSFGLFRIPVNLDAGETAGEVEKVEGTAGTPIRYLSISADGRRIAYSTQSLVSDIWQLPLSSAGDASGPPAPLYEDTSRRKTNPAVSPDGKWIAFGVWRLGSPTSVWMVDSEGKNPAPLTTDEGGSGVPNWMPGGDRIAYLTRRGERAMLYTKSWKTGDERPLLELPPLANTPRLSPDGKLVAYNSRAEGVINVWVQALDGGEPRRLTSDAEMAGFPAWSPDGKWLALELRRGDDMHVAVMPAEGGEPVQLTHEPGLNWPHSFSPDGEFIAFAGFRDGLWNLYAVSRKTGAQRQLTHFDKTNSYVRYPAWSPTGDRIVFEHAEATGNVWLVELK